MTNLHRLKRDASCLTPRPVFELFSDLKCFVFLCVPVTFRRAIRFVHVRFRQKKLNGLSLSTLSRLVYCVGFISNIAAPFTKEKI